MTKNEIGKIIVEECKCYKELGPGLFETAYEVILAYGLKNSVFFAALCENKKIITMCCGLV